MTMSAFGVDDTRISKGFAGAKVLKPIHYRGPGGRVGQKATAAAAPARDSISRHLTATRDTFGQDAAKLSAKAQPLRDRVTARPVAAIAGTAAAGVGLGAGVASWRKRGQTPTY